MTHTPEVKKVYSYTVHGGQVKFGYRWMEGASIAGEWQWKEYDEQWEWHWHPSPGIGTKPTDSWLCWNRPDEVA